MLRRVLRFFLSLVVALVLVGLVVLIVIAANPGWQRGAIESVLEARSGGDWRLESAHFAAPGRIEGSGVYALFGADGAYVQELELRFDWGRTLGAGGAVVTGGEIVGLTVDPALLATLPLPVAQLPPRMPSRAETVGFASDSAQAVFLHLAERGWVSEVQDLAVEGAVQLADGRQFDFSIVILHANADVPEEILVEVRNAELR